MHRSSLWQLFVVAGLLSFTTQAFAFHLTTHVATANRTLDQLGSIITPGSADDTLVFEIKGRRLEIKVSAKEAYRAILANQDFFRAGVIGPDYFPDVVTGQFWEHSNQNPPGADLVDKLTGGTVKACGPAGGSACINVNRPAGDPSETRRGSSELRAIDFAMAMFEFLQSGKYVFAPGERDQALAFIMGYLSHGVGDSFAHSWVNKYAGGAWMLTDGSGIFGPTTEEIKHIAIEALVDTRVPGSLQNRDGSTGGELDRMDLRAPILFLDAFFSGEIPNAIPYGNKAGTDLKEFAKFYAQVDRHYGSALYGYFNGQVAIARALKNWSRLGPFMNFADNWQPGPFVNLLLDIVDFPDQIQAEVEGWIGGDLVPFLTGGFLKCELFLSDTTGLEALRAVWGYLGGFNARIAHFEDKARIARINWLRLSECTAQNLVRNEGGKFDPAFPDKFRDACAVLADRPFVDEGDPLGLYRGSVRGGNEDDDEFLRDLKNYFRGLDDDGDGVLERQEPIEQDNGHRAIGPNITRERSYLLGFSVVLDDLEDLIITDNHEVNFDKACALVRDPAEHRCLNLELLPLALGVREGQCLVEEAVCIAGKVKSCLSGLCKTGCSVVPDKPCVDLPVLGNVCIPISLRDSCTGLCDLGHDVCVATVNSTCNAFRPCIPFTDTCFDTLANICKGALNTGCDFVAGGDPRCASNLFNCAAEGIDCSLDALRLVFLSEGWADEILDPFAKFCNAFDFARAVFRRFDTVEERRAMIEQMGVPLDRIDETRELAGQVVDAFPTFPPEYFVNVVFALEDLRESPQYLAQYLAALQRFEQQNNLLPDGDLKRRRQEAARKLRAVADAASQSGVSSPLLVDLKLPQEVRALDGEINQFKALTLAAFKDPATAQDSVNDFRSKLDRFEIETLALPEGQLKEARKEFIQRGRTWLTAAAQSLARGEPVPVLIVANLDPLFDVIDEQLLEFEELIKAVVIPTVAGPTATRILRDVGPDMTTTFNQFVNAVQGMKIVPLYSQGDVERLFTQEGVPLTTLPWRVAAGQGVSFSGSCTNGNPISIYCDVMKSFDDPNCAGARLTGCASAAPVPPLNWIPGRGVVAWNDFDPTGKAAANVLTNFPLASSQAAYDTLYTRIFDVPAQAPPATGFEGDRPWTSGGPGRISTDPTDRTQGNQSLKVEGCGYTPITSPTFSTTEFGFIGSSLAFDIKLPVNQSNPFWTGQAQLFVTIPGAGINNTHLGSRELTPLKPLGEWHTLEFPVPTNVQDAFLGVFANVTFTITVNVGSCLGPVHIDNLRFTGTLRQRTQFKQPINPISPSNLFGFENRADFTSNRAALRSETTLKTQGNASLGVIDASGWNEIVTRAYSNADAGTIRNNLRVDLYIPNPQPNPFWGGDVQLSLNCPSVGLFSRWIGQVPLTNLFQSEFNSLKFPLPGDVVSTLRTRTYSDCSIKLILNVAQGSGTFFFDNLGFVD